MATFIFKWMASCILVVVIVVVVMAKSINKESFDESKYINKKMKHFFDNNVMSYNPCKMWLFRKLFVNLWRMDSLWCGYCAYKFNLAKGDLPTIDHIIPKALGGSNYIENLTPSCKKCNDAKGMLLINVKYPVMGFGHKGVRK